jgi:hypothetical protein
MICNHQHDFGPFRHATFDACISISALQWLCHSSTYLILSFDRGAAQKEGVVEAAAMRDSQVRQHVLVAGSEHADSKNDKNKKPIRKKKGV